jgi:peptidoglycan/LPS O-acetylase OafA/YrhL
MMHTRVVGPVHENSTAAYRPDIDGLRAISILLVVGYHAQPWLIPGGFVGVDIFFVISGFLITRIILSQLETGRFSLMDFYARRVRRIFPALAVVLTATYLIGWFVLLPDSFSTLGKNTAAGVAFVSNIFQLGQTGYFAEAASKNPLLHLWSLGIEEQFYIFWPLTLLITFGSRRRLFWMSALAAASFSVSLMIFLGYKEWSFYSPMSRAWELLAGGIVAANHLYKSDSGRSAQTENLCAAIGAMAIFGGAFGLTKESLFPGLYALLPVGGAVMIIASPNSLLNNFVLSNRFMVLIGLISYPLYLWHWPLLCYLAILRNGVPNFIEIWAVVLVAGALSWFTFRFVEVPIRRQPSVVPKISFALVAIGTLGIVTAAGSGLGFRFPAEIRDIAELAPQNNVGLRDKCFLETAESRFDEKRCIEQGDKPLLFLWGDSNAATLYPGLVHAQATTPFRLARFASAGCAPILAAGFNKRCDGENEIAFGFIKSSRPEIVLLHAMWDLDKGASQLQETIRQLKAIHIPRIVILGPVPLWKRTLPHELVNFYRWQHAIPESAAFSKAAGVEYISAWHALCNPDGCKTRVGGNADGVITTDAVHLSDAGSNFLVAAIGSRLFAPR